MSTIEMSSMNYIDKNLKTIEEAYKYAKEKHEGQKCLSNNKNKLTKNKFCLS